METEKQVFKESREGWRERGVDDVLCLTLGPGLASVGRVEFVLHWLLITNLVMVNIGIMIMVSNKLCLRMVILLDSFHLRFNYLVIFEDTTIVLR